MTKYMQEIQDYQEVGTSYQQLQKQEETQMEIWQAGLKYINKN